MEKFISYFKLSIERLKSNTPQYFKKIIYFGVGLGTLGLGLASAGTLVPAIIHTIAGYLVTVGVVSAVVAKTTTCDPALTQKSEQLLKTTKEDASGA